MANDVPARPKVVSLHGGEILQPGEPCADLVQKLENILEMARSGEVDGMVIALHHADGRRNDQRAGAGGRSMIGMIEVMKFELIERDQRQS